MKRFMVDIETFGLKPGAQLRSIAVTDFTNVSDMHSMHVRIADPTGPVDPDTLKWWSEQNDEVRAHFDTLPVCPIQYLPFRLAEFFHDRTFLGYVDIEVEWWAKSPDFDRVLIEAAFERASGYYHPPAQVQTPMQGSTDNRPMRDEESRSHEDLRNTGPGEPSFPWKFYQWRDARTVISEADKFGFVPEAKPVGVHNALIDAEYQARVVDAAQQYVEDEVYKGREAVVRYAEYRKENERLTKENASLIRKLGPTKTRKK